MGKRRNNASQSQLTETCLRALTLAKETIVGMGEGGRAPAPTSKDEPVTKSDLCSSRVLIEHFTHSGLEAVLTGEEAGQINFSENPQYRIFFDELDGTFNWQRGGLFSSAIVVSAFDYKERARFKDAVFAGVLDITTGNLWYAERGEGCFFNGNRVTSSGRAELGKKNYSIIDLGPCPSKKLQERFSGFCASIWPHNISCAGIHLAGVASGHIDVAVLPLQKAHELGAGYLLIREAGRYLVDFQGKSLTNREFNFNEVYEIVAADTRELGKKVLQKIKYSK